MLPLHVGNKWVYRTTIYNYDSLGNITNSQTFDTLEIIGDTIIDCDTKYIYKMTQNFKIDVPIIGPLLSEINTISNTTDGFKSLYSITLPYPVSVGNKIKTSTNNYCTSYDYLFCDTITFNDSLLNQTFFCQTYTLDSSYSCNGSSFYTTFYSYGIGLINLKNYGTYRIPLPPYSNHPSHMYYPPNRLHSTMELINYTLY